MGLKMATLVERSGVTKSTILFYLKEGLLPPPKKPKPNVHLYHDSCVAILQFIKYLQEHLNYSITEIKSIIKDNKIDFNSDSDVVVNYLVAMSGLTKEREIEDIKKRAKAYQIDSALFDAYEKQAKKLAKLEYEMGAKLLESHKENEKNTLQKLLFDILLTLKPYIFNQATIKEHKKRVAENAKELS
jgi:DNA-binding transcriptional MerR regulator